MQPFDTEEILTVTMTNGDIFTVQVTDVQGNPVNNQYGLENGQYMIVGKSGSKYYAYANSGKTVEVSYNTTTDTVIYTGSENLVWDVSNENNQWQGRYTFKADADPTKYIRLDGGEIQAQWWGWVYVMRSDQVGKEFYLQGDGYGNPCFLTLKSNKFIALSTRTSEPDAVYLVKVAEAPVQYTFTVTVDNVGHGTVSGTNDDGQSTGAVSSFTATTEEVDENGRGRYNAAAHPITAAEKSGYTFDHWEMDGEWISAEKRLDTELSFSADNAVLKAVYKADTVISDDLTDQEIEDRLKAWATEMISDTVTTSKTAQVYNYDDRIYEITMGASSGVRRVLPSLDLAFITDVSRSMFFPATLQAEATFTQGTANDTSTEGHWEGNWSRWVEGTNDSSLYDWLYNNADTGKIYYVVSSDSSATVTALYYGGKTVNKQDPDYANEWRRIDASYLNPPDVGSLTSENDKNALKGTAVTQSGSNCVYYWNNLTGTVYTQVGTLRRMDYLKAAAKAASEVLYGVDPSAQVGLVTFAADAYDAKFYPNPGSGDNAFYTALTTADLKGGTDQADGLDKGKDLFKEKGRTDKPVPKRVAILITDGAPNQSGRTDWNSVIAPAATGLKNVFGTDSVELFTLGLSMDMVGDTNRLGLQSIATGGISGNHWFEASNGPGIVAAIESIIERIIHETSLKGNITDTIDSAFYPVTKDGVPLGDGDMINLTGEKIDSVPADGKYGVITEKNGVFTVQWSDQVVGYSENEASTWEGRFYVKAKEDFLGGNSINTNTGDKNQFVPSKYVIDGTEYDLFAGDDEKLKRSFETPYVNVDELTLTQNSTEWTVYLGTEVSPMEQLEALLDAIRVKEVVKASTNYMITDSSAMLHSSKTDDSETFPLKQAIDLESLSQEEKEALLSGGTITKPYTGYGHTTGKMVLSLSKVGTGADYNTHNTVETGAAVERYIVSTIFQPTAANTELAYHTTPGGSPGSETDTMRSINTHVINVYAKKLTIQKVDQGDNLLTKSPATFTLYRKAVNTDDAVDYLPSKDVPQVLPENDYILVETLTTSGGTVTTTGDLNDSYEYYLVETQAPAGYILLPGYFKVRVDIRDSYVQTLDTTQTSETAWDPWVLSEWDQSSTVVIENVDDAMTGYAVYGVGAGAAYTYDMNSTAVEWKIRNDAGYELPSTGGPGTRIFTILGSILILGAGVLLWRRWRIFVER